MHRGPLSAKPPLMRNGDDDQSIPLPDDTRLTWVTDDLVYLDFPVPEAVLPRVLTEAEQAVALLAFEGATNGEIAEARSVSVKTIGNQLESIYRKLGVSSRAELVLRLKRGRRRGGS